MEIKGQQLIAAPREQVWHALNDPAILQRCLPGCESVVQESPENFKVVVKVSIGPLRARFQGKLLLSDIVAPQSCTMHFEGQGGATGFGQGQAAVELKPSAQGTELHYTAQVQVGGKLAQIGSRLIESVARKMTDDFFQAFHRALEPETAAAPEAAANGAPEPTAGDATSAPAGQPVSAAPAAVGAAAASGPQVPAWWLAPAALLGGLLVLMGARWLG